MEDHLDERSSEEQECPDDESRREVLKTFGRYAAAAPTAMVLLGARRGHADLIDGILELVPEVELVPEGGYG